MMQRLTVLSLLAVLSTVTAFDDLTITEWLTKNNNFTTLLDLFRTAGLDTVLGGSGPYTLFAPTDAAFSVIPTATLNALKADKPKLEIVLKYHLLNGFFLGPQITDGSSKQTLNGEFLQFKVLAGGTAKVQSATLSSGDEILNNGVIHVIDTVLLPATSTLGEILLSKPMEYGDLVLLLTITDLLPALNAGPYTVFAPLNSAFDAIIRGLPTFDTPNAKQIYAEVVKSHVVNGTYLSTDLHDGDQLTTLHNNVITVNTKGGVFLGPFGARVMQPDIQGLNGVIHGIDSVMVPSDLQNLGRR